MAEWTLASGSEVYSAADGRTRSAVWREFGGNWLVTGVGVTVGNYGSCEPSAMW